MAKRRHVNIIISDDEEEDGDRKEVCHSSQSQTPQLVLLGRCSVHGSMQTSTLAGVPLTDGDSQCLNMKPWTEKFCPKEIADLAIHPRKVAEVRDWFEMKLRCVDKIWAHGNLLVLSGPTGVGKTAVVKVLANFFQLDLYEWEPPVPTLWNEHLHHVNTDVPYVSKVTEFLDFLEKVKKYPGLPLVQMMPGPTSSSGKPKMLFLDDLPAVHGREQAKKLCDCLCNFAASVQFPTVVIVTDFLATEEYGQGACLSPADILQALESGGAYRITFNPITANAVKKVLNRITQSEKLMVSQEAATSIAKSCEGDIRHAINSLQFMCVGLASSPCTWDPGGDSCPSGNLKRRKPLRGGPRSKKVVQMADPTIEHKHSLGCRDGVLSLFHALGKVLHNKRLTDRDKDSGESSINMILRNDLQRHLPNMEAPEVLLSQCHAEAAGFLYFLHENVLEFVDDEGIEDVSNAMTYFSDADYILGSKYRRPSTRIYSSISYDIASGDIAETVAGSIVARGVLFANTHPAKHRWQSLRAPVLRQVDRLSNDKRAELRAKSWRVMLESSTIVSCAIQATECEPYRKRLVSTISPSFMQWGKPSFHKEISEADLETCEEEQLHHSSQEHALMTNIMAMDINSGVDGGLEDDIEEW